MQEQSQDWHTEGVQIISGDKLDTNMPQAPGIPNPVCVFNLSDSLEDRRSIHVGEIG